MTKRMLIIGAIIIAVVVILLGIFGVFGSVNTTVKTGDVDTSGDTVKVTPPEVSVETNPAQ